MELLCAIIVQHGNQVERNLRSCKSVQGPLLRNAHAKLTMHQGERPKYNPAQDERYWQLTWLSTELRNSHKLRTGRNRDSRSAQIDRRWVKRLGSIEEACSAWQGCVDQLRGQESRSDELRGQVS